MIADGLPSLGYLTLLDSYILSTFAFMAAVGLEVALINWGADTEKDEDINSRNAMHNLVAVIDCAVWLVWHLALGLYVACRVLPVEAKKAAAFATGE